MAKTFNTFTDVATGDVYPAASHNAILENLNNHRVPPSCSVRPTSDRAFTGGTYITFDTAAGNGCHDTDSMWSAGSPTRITINTAGLYEVTFSWFVGNASAGGITGSQGGVYVNQTWAACYGIGGAMNGSVQSSISGAGVVSLSAGDYIELGLMYISGTGAGSPTTFAATTRMSATWIGQVS